MARREAKVLLGKIAQGENLAKCRLLDTKAMTVRQLCEKYLEDAKTGLVLGKGGRPKKALTITTEEGRINRHIVPLLGTRRARDIELSDINRAMKNITVGKTRIDIKTRKRGRAIVRGGSGAAVRTIGLLGGIFTYAVDNGIVEKNPTKGVRKAKDRMKKRHLTEAEYRLMDEVLRERAIGGTRQVAGKMIRLHALTGCRRNEISELRGAEPDTEGSALRLVDSKEGASVGATGLPVLTMLDQLDRKCRGLSCFRDVLTISLQMAILLIGGNKTGDDRFYERMIPMADDLYDVHLKELKHERLI